MGLFDSLKKLGADLEKEIEKGVGKDALQNLKDAVANAGNTNGYTNNSRNGKAYEIPTQYSEFPTFPKNPDELKTAETDKYERCTMDFYNASEQEVAEYVSKIVSLGYMKNTNVRYDKGNTYIIVDTEKGGLNLVFHIKR